MRPTPIAGKRTRKQEALHAPQPCGTLSYRAECRGVNRTLGRTRLQARPAAPKSRLRTYPAVL